MPKKGKKSKSKHDEPEQRQRHSARKWIVKALESADASVRMKTSEIQAKASKLAGEALPGYSVYQALRTLVKREVVAVKREGRELTYQLKERMPSKRGRPAAAPAVAAPASPPAAAPPMVAAAAPALPAPPAPAATTTALALVDTLSPGEIAILHVGETHIEAATNVHGKLVVEKHKRPA